MLGADVRWPVSVGVEILTDVPHLKAGGTDGVVAPKSWPQWIPGADPFTAIKLRTAYRHGGAVPWSMVKEVPHDPVFFGGGPLNLVLSSPADADARYVMEAPVGNSFNGYSGGYGFADSLNFVAGVYAFGYTGTLVRVGNVLTYNFVPNPVDALIMTDMANAPKYLIRTMAPTLNFTPSHASPSRQNYGNNLMLIKLPGTLNGQALSAQVSYFCVLPANSNYMGDITYILPGSLFSAPQTISAWGWDGVNYNRADFTFTSTLSGYSPFARIEGGWNYAVQCDETTGAITSVTPFPEGRVREGRVSGYIASPGYDYGPAFGYTDHTPTAFAMSWPTGIRSIKGSTTTGTQSRLVWKPAGPWRYMSRSINPYRADASITSITANVTPLASSSTSFIPLAPYFFSTSFNSASARPEFFRGFTYDEENAGIQATLGGTPTGGWNILATFPSHAAPASFQDGVLGGTLPAVGQEIWVAGGPLGGSFDTLLFYHIVPEATVSPVAIPDMFGGVVQGGTP